MKSLVFYLRNRKHVSNPREKKKKTGVIPETDCEQAFQYLGGRNKNFRSVSWRKVIQLLKIFYPCIHLRGVKIFALKVF